ncbi:hypothetical protein Emed_003364 [Eimeria media]
MRCGLGVKSLASLVAAAVAAAAFAVTRAAAVAAAVAAAAVGCGVETPMSLRDGLNAGVSGKTRVAFVAQASIAAAATVVVAVVVVAAAAAGRHLTSDCRGAPG